MSIVYYTQQDTDIRVMQPHIKIDKPQMGPVDFGLLTFH